MTTLEQLSEYSSTELLAQKWLGRKVLWEIEKILADNAMSLTSNRSMKVIQTYDFERVPNELRSHFLAPVATVRFSRRARNVIENLGIQALGQLCQLSEARLLRQRNLGRKSLVEIKSALAERGLSLGSKIINWPSDEDLARLLDERADKGLDAEALPDSNVNSVEDEIAAAIEAALPPNLRPILIRRTGLDGGPTLTLEQLGNDPTQSGLKTKVTRERIRQLESKATRIMKERAYQTPWLDRAINIIVRHCPINEGAVPALLIDSRVARSEVRFSRFETITRLLGKGLPWKKISRPSGSYLVPAELSEKYEKVWSIVSSGSDELDFVDASDQLSQDELKSADLLTLLDLVIGLDSQFEWLDRDSLQYWDLTRPRRGWNKIINVSRKVLSVTPSISVGRLFQGVKRARTVRRMPTLEAFTNMLVSDPAFEVNGEIASRGEEFERGTISRGDRLLIEVAHERGTVLSFSEIRECLVRKGLSSAHAQIRIAVNPFWNPIARGKYRFVANSEELKATDYSLDILDDEDDFNDVPSMEFKISHRHLVAGTERLGDLQVESGEWEALDLEGRGLGMLAVRRGRIEGLDAVLKSESLEVGHRVCITFTNADRKALFARS